MSEFFAADVVVSAAVVLAFLIFERRRLGRAWWFPVLGLMIFGVSVALPLLLYLRGVPPSDPGESRGGPAPAPPTA